MSNVFIQTVLLITMIVQVTQGHPSPLSFFVFGAVVANFLNAWGTLIARTYYEK